MFEYIVEIISIAISIKVLTRIGDYLKNRGLFEDDSMGDLIKFGYWCACFFIMAIIWAIAEAIFGYKGTSSWESVILLSSINGFSSRYFGKKAFWVLLIFTFLIGSGEGFLGIIMAMLFFFSTRHYEHIKSMDNESLIADKDDLDLLDSYLLKAKEYSSKALEDFQNNNINNAIENWTISLDYYKKAEKIAKSRKDEELVSSIRSNIKPIVQNILNAKIGIISEKLGG